MSWALLFISLLLPACIVSTDHRDPTPEQAIPRLVTLLTDPNPDLRRTAAQSLGKIARKDAAPALTDALRDSNADVRRHAAWALGMIGPDALGQERSPLADLLFDNDPSVREAASLALGLTGDTQSGIELLVERLQDPETSSDSKRLAAASLGNIEARSSIMGLTSLLADPDAQVRRWAVAALGEIADKQAITPLSALMAKDPDPGVRLEAAFRLGKFGGVQAKPALTAALQDNDENVRRIAASGLQTP